MSDTADSDEVLSSRPAGVGWRVRIALAVLCAIAAVVIWFTNQSLTDRFTENTRNRAELRLALYSGNMISELPVRVESDDGVIVAKGMQVTERGRMIIFTGKTRLTLHNDAKGS